MSPTLPDMKHNLRLHWEIVIVKSRTQNNYLLVSTGSVVAGAGVC